LNRKRTRKLSKISI